MIFIFLVLAFLTYGVIPRVWSPNTAYGYGIEKNGLLGTAIQDEIRSFIRDTAISMQNVMVTQNGKVIFEEGDTEKLINCHSARKSVMSVLIGIAADKGMLNIDETIGSIGIDESKTPLTTVEKSATIRDLLMCTSSIFLKAEAEHDWAEDIRPKRGEYQPGEYFFYNNFDFNVLGEILKLKTKMSIGEFMEKYLAKPLQMQDFSAANIVFNSPWPVPNKTDSDYPVFWMYMSTRDFIKVGILITQNGKWQNQQVVSSEWVKESLMPFTKLDKHKKLYDPYDAFSYSWWIENDTKTVWADGYGGQFMCIDTTNNLVVVQRNFTENSLFSSGMFLIDKNRDNNPKRDLIHIYNKIKKELTLE